MGTVRISSAQSSPTVSFFLEADHINTDTVGQRWLVRFYLRASKGGSSFYSGSGNQIGRYNGNEFGRHSGSPFLPSGSTGWNDGPWDVWINSNGGGAWTMPLSMQLAYGNINTTLGGSIPLPQIATIPQAPTPVAGTPDQITATSLRYSFSGNWDGGSPIIRYEYQFSTSPTFASGNSGVINNGLNGIGVISDLTPNTVYYQRSRGVNAVGNGPWSSITSGQTLVATAPGMLVSPSLDGRSASVALTPPPEIPSPSGYRLEYRIGTGAATGFDVTTSPYSVPNLTPGTTYQWRSAAVKGAYTGPFTAWTSVAQPNTNTNPGDYFDGSSPARTDVSYAWLGAANNTMSRAVGKAVTGWGAFGTGNAVSGGTGAVFRVTGGRSQAFAARVDFWSPTTVAGFHAGTAYDAGSTFPALQGATYNGLIHVRLSRNQRLAAMYIWLNGAGVEVGRSMGTGQLVGASTDAWTPIRVAGTPPAGATRGAIRVIDVAGTGWSTWKSGDSMLLDDAITPFADYYFDGSTPDTADWNYSWDGAANASPSRGTANTAVPVSPLVDPDCPPVPPPPRPPQIADDCVEDDTFEWRRFWQEIPAVYVPTWVDTVPILKIETTTAVRLVRVRYYPNPFGRALADLEREGYCSEQTISYIPGDTIFTLDGVGQRAYAELEGSSSTLAADHLLRGDSTLWPVIGCGVGYYVTVDVPTDTPSNALGLSYSLVQRY